VREPRYPAARSVAARLEAHFAREAPSGTLAPDAAAIEALVDAGFWASLQREEGYVPEISLAFLPPDEAVRPLRLRPPLPLDPHTLAQLSPAVERPGIHLGVWRSGGELRVWGTTRTVPPYCFVLEVIAPGLLVVKHRSARGLGQVPERAVFQGDEVKLLGQGARVLSEHSPLLRPLLAPESAEGSADVLLRLRGVRCARIGAAARCSSCPRETTRGASRSCGRSAMPSIRPSPSSARCWKAPPRRRTRTGRGRASRRRARRADRGRRRDADHGPLRAAGVRCQDRPARRPDARRARLRDGADRGRPSEVVAPLSLGGTRHISGAQFAQDQKRAVALVASQDGRFTVFAWCEREGMVHAHRVEALLL
jgi:hypothetical protein